MRGVGVMKKDKMKYLAHIDGKREQSIKEHLEGTAVLAAEFAKSFRKEQWGYCAGMLHDIGKYSEAFQERIRGNNTNQVDHSTAGAKVCMEKVVSTLFWGIVLPVIMQDFPIQEQERDLINQRCMED